MTMPLIDLKLAELLCSRLCHDLIGPVGAINNGLELLEDYDPSMADDVLPLLASSAKQAWNRLAFFRAALGFSGGRTAWPASELGRIAEGMVVSDKVSLDWQLPDSVEVDRRQGQLLLNLALLATEILTRGGSIRVTGNGSKSEAVVEASGPDAVLAERHRVGLTAQADSDAVEERGILAHMTGLLARAAGTQVTFTQGPGKVEFRTVLLPS
jgi:histidine phosphotransferase ChpT